MKSDDTLDGWLLEARLGAGGWGQVFRATRDGESKALQVMHPDFAADRGFVECFKKETETLIRLPRHANLVRFDGFGYCPSRLTWYLAMEYVDGPTLEEHLAASGGTTPGLRLLTVPVGGDRSSKSGAWSRGRSLQAERRRSRSGGRSVRTGPCLIYFPG